MIALRTRIYGLGIWGLGLGYFLFYTPYSGLAKATSKGLFPGTHREIAGLTLLPASVLTTVVGVMTFFTLAGWWRYVGHREVLGFRLPTPNRWTFLSGLCSATIIATTTLAFTFDRISVVLMLVLLRGGVLVLAPIVDAMLKRRVRWFSWAGMAFSLAAVLTVLGDTSEYRLTLLAVVDVAAYLAGYFFRFQFMTRLAKCRDEEVTRRYLVEEQMVATPFLFLFLVVIAALGPSGATAPLRAGFAALAGSDVTLPAVLIGLSYAGLLICTSLIFLDRRENTFCVPIHCGSSMLAGIAASYALANFTTLPPPTVSQLLAAVLIMCALLFLSPLHHLSLAEIRTTLARWLPTSELLPLPTPAVPTSVTTPLQRLFLFVCAGNTSRSPMAEAICNAELARRLNLSWDAVSQAQIQALSAGLAPRAGAPMTPESRTVLQQLGVLFRPRHAQALSSQLMQRSEVVFCMTRKLRQEVIEQFPAAAAKVHCLDPAGDIEDPSGTDEVTYARVARRIQELVRQRLNEIGVPGAPIAGSTP